MGGHSMRGWFLKTILFHTIIAGLAGNARAQSRSWFDESLCRAELRVVYSRDVRKASP